jgi:hypothetical protein
MDGDVRFWAMTIQTIDEGGFSSLFSCSYVVLALLLLAITSMMLMAIGIGVCFTCIPAGMALIGCAVCGLLLFKFMAPFVKDHHFPTLTQEIKEPATTNEAEKVEDKPTSSAGLLSVLSYFLCGCSNKKGPEYTIPDYGHNL